MSFDGGMFQCDECPDYVDTGEEEFGAALVRAKRKGWRTFRRPPGKWTHVCPECVAKFASGR